ncbi:response regulator [Pelagibius sp. Alg239-R121]|uniref:response regulator n=1 Tax=Pelagibius sp. Alg239-R121 TaxID=2993448 RepID=UPI0024A659FF|nr:response regulator [Pelagibius sp. Alg239-R121]
MAKILIVDDEPLICEMLEVFLSRAGHDITTASNGVQAMEIASKLPIDLVIADIVMPEKDGLETITELRKQNPDVNVIAISGGSRIGNFDFLAMAEKFGANATFYKPLDNDALLQAVEKCLGKK